MTAQEILARAETIAGHPHTFTLRPNENGAWTSGVIGIPGVISEGDTPNEAITMARDALREWAIVRLEDGLDIPAPFNALNPGGNGPTC